MTSDPGPNPRSLHGSWAPALDSSPKTSPWLGPLPDLILCVWHHNCPSSANCYFPPVSPHCGQRGKPAPSAPGRGTRGFCWHCTGHPRGSFGCNTLALGTGTETHTHTHAPLPTQGQGQGWSLCSCSLTPARTGTASVRPRQAEVLYMGSEPCSCFSVSGISTWMLLAHLRAEQLG